MILKNFVRQSTENEKVHQVFFYPNPSSDQIFFDKISDYRIFDCSGRLICSGKSQNVDINNFQAGIYFLNVENKQGKLIIHHR